MVRRAASEAEIVDADGSNVLVSVWVRGDATLRSLAECAGPAVAGRAAAAVEGEVELIRWPGVHICIAGVQAQSLASLDASVLRTRALIATFTQTWLLPWKRSQRGVRSSAG